MPECLHARGTMNWYLIQMADKPGDYLQFVLTCLDCRRELVYDGSRTILWDQNNGNSFIPMKASLTKVQ